MCFFPLGLAGSNELQETSENGSAFIPIIATLLFEDDETLDLALPIANAGEDAPAFVGEMIFLDGSRSFDAQERPLSFTWSFVEIPEDSLVALVGNDTTTPSFSLDKPGNYTVQLIVNNGEETSNPDLVQISTVNRAPESNAGLDQSLEIGGSITLDGSGSFDLDGDEITFSWSVSDAPLNSSSEIVNADTTSPNFSPVLPGSYTIDLVVNDGVLDSEIDQMEVSALYTVALAIEDPLLGVDRFTPMQVSLSSPAPEGGLILALATDNTILGLSMTELQFVAGETSKSLILMGVSASATQINVSGEFIFDSTVDVEVTTKVIEIRSIEPVAPGAATTLDVFLSEPAPIGGLQLELLIFDPSVASATVNTVMIEEGGTEPATAIELTGIMFGETSLRVSASGYASDIEQINVALQASFSDVSIEVPEFRSRGTFLNLELPAPAGGIEFDLSLVLESAEDRAVFSTNETVRVEEGETQSQAVLLTALQDGSATLQASAQNFVPTTARVTVLDVPDVYIVGANFDDIEYIDEVVVGKNLQSGHRLLFEEEQLSPIDILISVESESGLKLAHTSEAEGVESLVIENFSGTKTGFFFIQGFELGDNVPLHVQMVEPGSMTPVSVEYRPTTLDVDPAAIVMSGSDFSTTIFSQNREVEISARALFDEETIARHGPMPSNQELRGGLVVDVNLQVDNPGVASLPMGAVGQTQLSTNDNIGLPRSVATVGVDPISAGVATVIVASQPEGFSQQVGGPTEQVVTVNKPLAWVGNSSFRFDPELEIGVNLQERFNARLQVSPPEPVDVIVSVPESSGVLLSGLANSAGGNVVVFEDITGTITPSIFIQGEAIGDDVPITVSVFSANTTVPVGYEQIDITVDVDPSGVYMRSNDYRTTVFSLNRTVQVEVVRLSDGEGVSPAGQAVGFFGDVRGGISLAIPIQVDDANIAALPNVVENAIVIPAGQDTGTISVDPIGVGVATVSIVNPPLNMSVPTNRDGDVVVTVDVPEARLDFSHGARSEIDEIIVGKDLQQSARVSTEVLPPSPVDVRLSVPANSEVLLSVDPEVAGSDSIMFNNLPNTLQTNFYVQGVALGDDVPLTVEIFESGSLTPMGFDIIPTFVDIDVPGVGFTRTLSSIETTTSSDNFNLGIVSGVFNDGSEPPVGPTFTAQEVRGGESLVVPISVADPEILTIVGAGAQTELTIETNSNFVGFVVDPLSEGATTISIDMQPNGFEPPLGRPVSLSVNVNAP